MDRQQLKDTIRIAMIMLIVIALGINIAVKYQQFYYNNQLLKNPCNVCLTENPEVTCYVNHEIENKKYNDFGRINFGEMNLTTTQEVPVDLYINIDDLQNASAIFSSPTN